MDRNGGPVVAILHYVEIENFKTFSQKIHIGLSHPAVIIGPNNSGKTSVIQALSLWDRGVKSWFEKKGDTDSTKERERYGAGINRLNILEVPVGETRFFWNGTRVKQGKQGRENVRLTINLGIEYKGKIVDCPFFFTYRDPEVIYSRPGEPIMKDLELIKYASALNFNMLYPMSGIESEETIFHDGWIKKLLGQGQTAQVLRNICYRVAEADTNNGTHDWEKITSLMRRLFLVRINRPVLIESRGSIIVVAYKPETSSTALDISLAGRGLQQALLILAYIYWHKNSILLIDEPDAHLEILRQRQIFTILKETARENGSQVIIATHSEAILDDAVDTNLTMLFLNGTADNLAGKRDMRNALRTYGIEQYYKAKVHPRIFYIEGSTDIAILRELAVLLGHKKAEKVLGDKLNPYYTQNIEPEDNLENQLDRAGGAFNRNYLDHFNALKAFVPELKGFALFDNDNHNRSDAIGDAIATVFWKEYEIENYFITPEVLVKFIKDKNAEQDLFMHEDAEIFIQALNEVLLLKVFNNSSEVLEQYYKGGRDLKRLLLRNIKMSGFAEEVFRRYAGKMGQPMLLTKGEFCRLVPFCPAEEIPNEVSEKLDMLVQYLEYEDV
jgi:Fe-S cluster assembly ATPase SufC